MYSNNNINFGFSGGRETSITTNPTTPFSDKSVVDLANSTFDTKHTDTFTYAYLRVAKSNFGDTNFEDTNRNNENVIETRNITNLAGNYLFTRPKYELTINSVTGLFRPQPTFVGELDDLPRGQKGRYRFKNVRGIQTSVGLRSVLSNSDFTINSEVVFGEYVHYDPSLSTGTLPLDFSPAKTINDVTRSRLTVPVLYSRYG